MLKDADYKELEEVARLSALAGGVAAMQYYRSSLATSAELDSGSNPATSADLEATRLILTTLHGQLHPLSGRRGCGVSYYAEELEGKEDIPRHGSPDRGSAIRTMIAGLGELQSRVMSSGRAFGEAAEKSLAVLFDALDGTTNFRSSIPLFCTAIAIFYERKPIVSAIYDPSHSTVYYASLRPGGVNSAIAWNPTTGERLSLVPDGGDEAAGARGLFAFHLTRSKTGANKRKQMLDIVDKIGRGSQGTFLLGSGQLALAFVASGRMSAFLNNHTRLWDVAAGEVLVRAAGGQVTDFEGNPIDYFAGLEHIGVIASSRSKDHSDLVKAVATVTGERA